MLGLIECRENGDKNEGKLIKRLRMMSSFISCMYVLMMIKSTLFKHIVDIIVEFLLEKTSYRNNRRKNALKSENRMEPPARNGPNGIG